MFENIMKENGIASTKSNAEVWSANQNLAKSKYNSFNYDAIYSIIKLMKPIQDIFLYTYLWRFDNRSDCRESCEPFTLGYYKYKHTV